MARVDSLWRYPVKSMAGEQVATATVTAAGIEGDRKFAVVEASGKVVSAKSVRHFAGMLHCEASLKEGGSVEIRMPDGPVAMDDINAVLSRYFGREVSLRSKPPDGAMADMPVGTLGGRAANDTEFAIAAAAPGTFFDFSHIHLVTTATIASLERMYPEGRFALRRFRPNVVVEDSGEFPENAWVGRKVAIGEVLLKVLIPCPRCVMTTLGQGDLPLDPGILKTAAKANSQALGDFGVLPFVGVYANVIRGGVIRSGDAVAVVD